jgi:hypothetical protein
MEIRMIGLAVATTLALAGCGKTEEAVQEKMVEKMMESQLEKDGGKASVDMSGGGTKVSTTDAQGRTTTMQIGNAKVEADEIGLPFYPGAEVLAEESRRMQTPESTMVQAALHSADDMNKVADFYREKLRAMSANKTMMDNSTADSVSMYLTDEKEKQSTMVSIRKENQRVRVDLMKTVDLRKG